MSDGLSVQLLKPENTWPYW